MRLSALAPAAILLGLFSLPAQAADLSALAGGLTSQLGGTAAATPAANTTAGAGPCNKQIQDLQAKIDSAKAKGDDLKVSGLQMAMDQASKGCTKLNGQAAAAPQPATAPVAAQDPKAQAMDTGMKALGGLLK